MHSQMLKEVKVLRKGYPEGVVVGVSYAEKNVYDVRTEKGMILNIPENEIEFKQQEAS